MKNKALEAAQPLFEAVLKLETREECRAFFEDLCTIQELLTLSQRYEVAGMLEDGGNYADISRTTGASTATICRVNKALVYGTGGYRKVLSRTKNTSKNEDPT